VGSANPETRGSSWRQVVRLPLPGGRGLELARWEMLLYAAIVVAVAATRFVDLDLRAYHHDESIHAKTSWDIMNGVAYRYNPVYHGPFQYFATAAVFKVFSAGDFAGRITPAIFGTATIFAVPWLYRNHLGRHGTWIAMVALTLSTGFMYFSRFARNDIYVAFWTVLLFGALLRYIDRPQRRWVILAAATLGFSFVTKENSYIIGFIFASFAALLALWTFFGQRGRDSADETARQFRTAFQALGRDVDGLAYALLLFLGVIFIFMTSFFTYLPGFREGIIKSFTVWADINESQRVNQPWFFYFIFTGVYEAFAALLGLAGIVQAIRRPKLLPVLFVYWTVLSFFIYSIAGEKAAWLSLHPALPLTLLASWYVGERFEQIRSVVGRVAVALITIVLLGWTAGNSLRVTFVYRDVPNDFVIYTQTSRDVLETLEIIEEAGRRTGEESGIPIFLHAETHWPYAWYLRDYTAVYYAPNMTELPTQKIVLAGDASARELGYLFVDYVGIEMKLREWFPEQVYKDWDWGSLGSVFDEENLSKLYRFYFFREPPEDLGSSNYVLYVHKDLLQTGPLGRFTLLPSAPPSR